MTDRNHGTATGESGCHRIIQCLHEPAVHEANQQWQNRENVQEKKRMAVPAAEPLKIQHDRIQY